LMLSVVLLRTASAAAGDQQIVLKVALGPNVVDDVAVTIRENPNVRVCLGQTVLLVHGLAHTAATWNPLIDHLFSKPGKSLICRVAAVDLPGHGFSGLPSGTNFGSLLIDDYVTAVLGALDGLREHHVYPNGIVAHSLGGLTVEGMQARLIAQGTSLARKYHVYWAMLLSPAYALEQPWAFADSGQALPVLSSLVTVDPIKGPVLRFDVPFWQGFFFSNFAQQIAPGTPSAEDIVSLGYPSDESFAAGAELVGAAPLQRVSVGTTPFAPCRGTLLLYVNPSQDAFNWRSEAQAAYEQLTGDARLWGFLEIDDEYAIHDMYIAQPALLLQKIRAALHSPL
jgi:pimeloyl-ACP methyl ester carboxylesterase